MIGTIEDDEAVAAEAMEPTETRELEPVEDEPKASSIGLGTAALALLLGGGAFYLLTRKGMPLGGLGDRATGRRGRARRGRHAAGFSCGRGWRHGR